MAVKLTGKCPSPTYYTVKGDTLADIRKDIDRSGPRDPNDGKTCAALTMTRLVVDLGKAEPAPAGPIEEIDGVFFATARLKALALRMESEILLPRLGSKALSKKAQAEWNRFEKALGVHEGKHFRLAHDECMAIAKEMEEMRAEGTGHSAREAAEHAFVNLLTALKDAYETGLDDRLSEVHAKFDKRTGHGPKLDTKVV